MVFKIFMTGVLVTLSVSVSAQAGPVAEKSPAQITCELTGDCDSFNQELATLEAGPSRGFRFDAPTKVKKTVAAAGAGYVAPRQQAQAPSANRARIAPAASSVRSGRSTLSINFASGSATIMPGSIRQARSLAESLNMPAAVGKRFIVGGHTDSVGNREYNLDLSRRRAEALVDFMVQNGVERSRLQPEGYGFDKPIPGLGAKAAANRRVEIVKID